MSPNPLPPFNPSEALEAQILEAILSEDHSLASIAALANTTKQALSLWLAKPAIRDRLANLESTAAWRIRITATVHLENSIAAIVSILKNPTLNALAFPNTTAADSAERTSDSPQQTRHSELGTQHSPSTAHRAPSADHPLTTLRAAESIRRSASTLLRLARFKPIGPTTVVPTGPSWVPRLSEPGQQATTPRAADSPPTPAPPKPNPARASDQPSPRRREPTPTPIPATFDPSLSTLLESHFTPTSTRHPRALNPAANLLQSAGSARGP